MQRRNMLAWWVAMLLACPAVARAQTQNSCGWSGVFLGGGVSVRALEVFDDGTGPALYAGTRFWQPGLQAAWGVKWDGSSWTPLGNGLNGHIFCLAVFDDGTGPALYAGGDFSGQGGIPLGMFPPPVPNPPLYGIAKWNGTAWSPVGNSFWLPTSGNFATFFGTISPGIVSSLVVFDDGTGPALYAFGGFTASGAVALPDGIAKWDGNTWSPPPAGMGAPSATTSFTAFHILGAFDTGAGPELYVGDGSLLGVIRKWNGSAWVGLGAGVSGVAGTPFPPVIKALAVFDDGSGPALYAGGVFDMAGSVMANGIAKWDGNSWSPLGNGLGFGQNTYLHEDAICSLAVYDDGTGPALFAGGNFSVAGNNIIKWNGTSWSDLNGGVYAIIDSLKVFDDGTGAALYAGALGGLVPPPGGGGFHLSGPPLFTM